MTLGTKKAALKMKYKISCPTCKAKHFVSKIKYTKQKYK